MSGNRSLLVLFGSQSGNAEDMASKIGKAASKYGLDAIVKGMDEVQISDLSSQKRIMICCSTWGEGEQPDNAEDLWISANTDGSPSMSGVNFSVLALGDTSYELFCESGKEWDSWLEKQGGNRLNKRVDCDVDYEDPAKLWMDETLALMGSVDDAGIFQEDQVEQIKAQASGVMSSKVVSSDVNESSSVEISADGDRSLTILFGSQSGNSEALAAKFSKQASAYGLEAEVADMDGFDLSSLTGKKRVLIICSTWGEGEQPDNAEELWIKASSASAGILKGVNFSVLALGDTSYELFCESGKEWDNKFEQLGGNRLVNRVDCDVDYDQISQEWADNALASMAAVDGEGIFHEEMVQAIMESMASDSSGASGEDGFIVPNLKSESIHAEISVFRYDPNTSTTGKDTWVCALPGHMSILAVLRTLKLTQDGSLTFRDGTVDDPSTAISINGRYVLPGNLRLDSAAPIRNGSISLRLEPLSGFEVIRDLAVEHWDLESKRESTNPWMISATRQGLNTPQGALGSMPPLVASKLHSMMDIHSYPIIHASSDATSHSDDYYGPAIISQLWARRNDPRTASVKKIEIEKLLDSNIGIKAETDLATIRRQGKGSVIHDALLDCKTSTLARDGFTGRHGKHAWWYTFTVKSSGRVNDTVLYRQVLGPIGLFGNLFTGVTARMVLGFTRTGGNMINDMLAFIAPPAGLGKMPRQFNSSVKNHHEVVAIYNEMDGRF
jgi:flavodoxin/succinate dehydrogenase/fumarate reductase-like Fe-S protein|tara:strand:+ start:2351 stop:4528 length:2178 start_codon:yes stop_codon:yes gene_type:complete